MALNVGDRVTVFGTIGGSYRTGVRGFATVAKVAKTKITLDDGSQWRVSGGRWGDTWSASCIAPFEQEHAERLKRQKVEEFRMQLAYRLSTHDWKKEPIETLTQVSELLERIKAKEEAASGV